MFVILKGLKLYQIDVKTIFLNKNLEKKFTWPNSKVFQLKERNIDWNQICALITHIWYNIYIIEDSIIQFNLTWC